MNLDAATLARIQFGFTVSFHIIFPMISIGLAMFLAIVEGLWLKTKDPLYYRIYRFWLGIFAMAFGVGVVTGIVLSFEFGLGFARFGQMAGPAIGSMIALEVLTCFFLEAGFLGIMLFGLNRVGPKLHFFATCMVALGTVFSASWILSANSWMQTPDGVAIDHGHVVVTDWLRVVVNPSWLIRLPHMLTAAYLTACFLVSGIGAWYLLRKEHLEFGRRTVSLGMGFATVLIAVQVFIGDILYGRMLQYQPAKLQAAEGLRLRGRLFTAPWFLRALVVMTPSGVLATLGGWYLAETGRQPWVIYGVLRTVDAVSPVPPNVLLSTLILFICVYTLFLTGFLAYTGRLIRRGPDEAPEHAEARGSLKPALMPAISNAASRAVQPREA